MTEQGGAEQSVLVGLLQRLARSRGDAEAWELLYRQLWPWVMAHSYRLLRGQRDLAEDASQEVFYRLLRYCDFTKLQDPNAFRAYLYTVCRNVARNYLSLVIEHSANFTLPLREEVLDTETLAPSQEQLTEVNWLLDELLSALKEDDRTLLTLLLEGQTVPEISRRLGIRYSNAAVRIHRLRKTLRKYLTDKGVLVQRPL